VFVEDGAGVAVHHDPGARVDFAVQLARAPARVSGVEPEGVAIGAGLERFLQDLLIQHGVDIPLHAARAFAPERGAIQGQNAFFLDGTALENQVLAVRGFLDSVQKLADARVGFAIQNQSYGALVIVGDEVDHGMGEVRVGEPAVRHQNLALGQFVAGRLETRSQAQRSQQHGEHLHALIFALFKTRGKMKFHASYPARIAQCHR